MSIISAFVVPHPPMIIPKIGRGQEIKVDKTIEAYNKISKKIAEIKPDTLVIISPHSVMYSDYIHISPGKKASGNFKEFGESETKFEVNYDEEFAIRLAQLSDTEEIPAGILGEKNKSLDHGTMVPLFFIDKYYKDYNIVRISISRLPFIEHYRFGKCISRIADELNQKVVIIASGDLSHMLKEEGPYGYTDEGPMFDRDTTEALSNGDFMRLLTFDEDFCEIAAECGLRSFIIMAGALDGKSVSSKLLSYEGPYGVGYAVASFDVTGLDNNRHFDQIYNKIEEERLNSITEKEDEYVKLARNSLESYIVNNKKIKKTNRLSNEMLTNKSGVFVSLKLNGQLRGCIGTISPTTDCIADEVIQNAISSGLEDPRFNPISKIELRKLEYSVDVLGETEIIKSTKELNVKKYGVIVTNGMKRGLLLPNLEGVETVEEQVSIALKKAGISPNENYKIERFKVVRHK